MVTFLIVLDHGSNFFLKKNEIFTQILHTVFRLFFVISLWFQIVLSLSDLLGLGLASIPDLIRVEEGKRSEDPQLRRLIASGNDRQLPTLTSPFL